MTDVFLLYQGAYSSRQLLGVYDAAEKAKTHADELALSWTHLEPHVHDWQDLHAGSTIEEPAEYCAALRIWLPRQSSSKFPLEYAPESERPGYQFRSSCELEIEQRAVR